MTLVGSRMSPFVVIEKKISSTMRAMIMPYWPMLLPLPKSSFRLFMRRWRPSARRSCCA